MNDFQVKRGKLDALWAYVGNKGEKIGSINVKQGPHGVVLRVMLADGDTATARSRLESAVQLWSEVGAPYETSVSRSIELIASRSIIGSARLSWLSSKSGPQRSAS